MNNRFFLCAFKEGEEDVHTTRLGLKYVMKMECFRKLLYSIILRVTINQRIPVFLEKYRQESILFHILLYVSGINEKTVIS